MLRKDFLKLLALAPIGQQAMNLKEFGNIVKSLPLQNKRMPVLFTSHGNPMDIPVSREERPFWNTLFELGKQLRTDFDVKAALIVSAHWCTRGSYVNSSLVQRQIYDYYGFPKEYYDVKYQANGAPDLAKEIGSIVKHIQLTEEWGLDHGAWPMLMHLFPDASVPVFQLSIDYYAKPDYHYKLGQELKMLRKQGVLIIGSGSLIHNLRLAGEKFSSGDMTPYGWETEYDNWLKQQIDQRNINALINYENSHKLGKLASPTPDHFVPVLYSLGLMEPSDTIRYFYEASPTIPAFSERSFIISEV